jgi:hypothetical protein
MACVPKNEAHVSKSATNPQHRSNLRARNDPQRSKNPQSSQRHGAPFDSD